MRRSYELDKKRARREEWKKARNAKNVIENNRTEKSKIAITNNLIFKYYAMDNVLKFGWKDTSYKLVESDFNDVETAAKEHFGDKTWEEKNAKFKQSMIKEVAQKYQTFLLHPNENT